ncbi:23S rRNA (uracil-5-)-methyltransferase RumA [Clostridium saccharoperbutylacetonicum]|uniref:23S rRNA (Uracil-5-)-methyltransferase RumA n=1 Tax=Clostridium saccharoperbutylacetonicum N1-4(HMT) TaxID=931276 RepID=M1N695_9CLOT|nr:23S rRNA (uracil(1939)-C(5))-methyltransferase RlmD [Clostridium saccharoperbutylacetonicum]AGF58932.1 23S rRNA (uracil-5-)-methyltransferase RumA [Clostridium saccharoperbutylacetonicum N1-4(HMT)]NRT60282.1 23S rRNA (uracil-5-)-methyltransferase RumA [Clostridium saccharoperbutylacetonicum]NSB23594.1 23S rRNA (uracil-5-)-methyltransferase RumA [Clostridium saccharoperbutylacetonicum]NSB42965.1 23S rRNA (uracil-5-)-methyltransferase RumA [Clostridium saccharoperbutylacetonicum]
MKKGSELSVKIEKTQFPSTGMGYAEDKIIYVKNAFPGQTITGRVKKKKEEYAELKLLSVEEKADYEVESVCSHFGLCGGCSSQTIPYEKQLEFLGEEVKSLFKEADVDMGEYLGIMGSPDQWEYRNKMEFTFGDEAKGAPLSLGMHMRGKSFGIVTVDDCKLVDEDYRKIIKLTVEYFRGTDLPYYRVMKAEGYLRHLVIRKAQNTGEILVNLVTTTQIDFDLGEYVKLLKDQSYKGNLVSILHTENDSRSDAVIPEKVNVLHGKDYIRETLLGLQFNISPFSFFQTNTKGAESLYSIVKDFMGDSQDKVVFDLYCGTGTIGQIVAPNAKKVVGIELIEEAVEAAKENAKLNGLNNCEFLAGDVAEIIKTIKDKPEIIILDPPRTGVHPKALDYVIKFNAPEIIYVSCNPKTLVTDLKVLTERGYKVIQTKVKDMFPNTPHVETVVKLALNT